MKEFINAWQKKYNAQKYPRAVYFTSIEIIGSTNSPDVFGQLVIDMLHWKDGKISVQNGSYAYSKPKPNTYIQEKHERILKSRDFFQWAKDINKSRIFRASTIQEMEDKFGLWHSLVIPAFVLHIINPFVYPMYDQNVERAKRALLAENIENYQLTENTYAEYHNFFESIVEDKKDIYCIKFYDEALWSFGKWLKQYVNRSNPDED